jgi:hypothetical protein
MTRTPRPTQTTGPLHFEDLAPPRFEDLVRQLAYRFRVWRYLDATGAGGSDGGTDIKGIEANDGDDGDDAGAAVDGSEIAEQDAVTTGEGKEWRIQCKRYRRVGPREAKKIAKELIPDLTESPTGWLKEDRSWDIVEEAGETPWAGMRRLQQSKPEERDWDTISLLSQRIPPKECIVVLQIGFIPYDRVVEVDRIGDSYFPFPQVFCRFSENAGPYYGELQHFVRYSPFDDGGCWLEANMRRKLLSSVNLPAFPTLTPADLANHT